MMRVMRRGLASFCLCVLAMLSACGDDKNGNGGPGGNGGAAGSFGSAVPLEDLPGELAAVFCGGIQECLGDLGAIFPQPDCEPTVENEYRNEQFAALEEAIAAGTVVYDGTEAPSCLAAFRALGCDLFSSRVPPACERTLAGTIPLGDPCSLNDECEGNAFCDRSGDSCPGVCAEPRTEGQSRL